MKTSRKLRITTSDEIRFKENPGRIFKGAFIGVSDRKGNPIYEGSIIKHGSMVAVGMIRYNAKAQLFEVFGINPDGTLNECSGLKGPLHFFRIGASDFNLWAGKPA
jgi:hypothetical protein